MQRLNSSCLSIFMLAVMVTGCALNTFKAKTGSGDPQAPRAIVLPEKNVAISDIDGRTVFVTARNWWIPVVTNTRASLVPGDHALNIKYAVTGWTSLGCLVTFNAESGKRYRISGKRMDFDDAPGFAAVKQPRIASVRVWVTDANTGDVIVDETACSPVKF